MNIDPDHPSPRQPPLESTEPFAAMVHGMDAGLLDNRLDVETHVSHLLGAIWQVCGSAVESETRIGLELIEYLSRTPDRRCVAALAALTTLGITPGLRAAAERRVKFMSRRGVPIPRWFDRPIRMTQCWQGGDVFGESMTVVCVVEGQVTRHGIVVSVVNDCPPCGPILSDAFITMVPDEMIAALHRPPSPGDPVVPPQQITPAEAAGLLEAGLAELDTVGHEPESESALLRLRALLAARCRLACGRRFASRPPAATDAELNRTLNAFLSAPQSAPFPRTDELVATVLLIAEFHLPGGLRVGPDTTRTFLTERVPARLEADSPLLPSLVDVLRAFNRWAAQLSGLDNEAVALLDDRTRHCAAGLADRLDDPGNSVPPDWPGLFG